jgi:hypothetical protein
MVKNAAINFHSDKKIPGVQEQFNFLEGKK